MGLIGACDTFWSLQRIAGEPDAALRIIGRDVEAQELALRFEAGFWTVLGDAATVLLNTAHQLILDTLMTEGRPLTPTMLATMLGVNLNTMKSHLTRLHERGLVLNLGNGHYIARIATPEHASDDQRATPATPATPATGAPAEPGTSAADVQGEEVLELPEESIPLTPALSTEAILADEACLTAGDGDSEVPGPTPRANDDHAQERTREGCTVAPVARVAGGAGVEALGLDGHVQPPSNGHHPGGAQPGPTLPCVVCGSVARWHDRGTMRCSRCWPPR